MNNSRSKQKKSFDGINVILRDFVFSLEDLGSV